MSYALDAAAERVGQQLLGDASSTNRSGCLSSAAAELGQPVELRAVGQRARRVDRRVAPRRPSRHRPTASKFSSAKPERIDHRVAAGARRVRAVLRHAARASSAPRRGCLARPPRAAGTSARRAGGGVPSRFSRIHLPRSTGDVRFGVRRHRQDAAVPEQAARGCRSASVTRRKWLAVHVRECRSAARAAR